MRKIDFSFPGGFPLDQDVLDFLQHSESELQSAFLAHVGITDNGNYILSGAEPQTNGTISAGILVMNLEIVAFIGGTGDATTKILKQESVEDAAFENGNNNPVFIHKMAVIDTNGVALSSFLRIPKPKELTWENIANIPAVVIDADYVHTDNNFTNEKKAKLEGIETGAEKNVQADWQQSDSNADDFIKNKPNINPLVVTHGTVQTQNRFYGAGAFSMYDDFGKNFAFIYPPTGFTINHLKGVTASLAYIHFGGSVGNDDMFYCRYQIDTPNNRIIVIGQATENSDTSRINYLAIWQQ